MNPLAWLATKVQFDRNALRVASAATVAASVLIVVTGGIVRVTGSGLGCPTWPTCTNDSLIATEQMGIHGAIEFGNRLLTGVLCVAVGTLIIVARCQRQPISAVTRGAWLQFWMVILNAVVGGITVLARLSPYVVAAHFLAAMLLLAAATYTYELIDTHNRPQSAAPHLPRRAASLSTALLLLTIITGAWCTDR